MLHIMAYVTRVSGAQEWRPGAEAILKCVPSPRPHVVMWFDSKSRIFIARCYALLASEVWRMGPREGVKGMIRQRSISRKFSIFFTENDQWRRQDLV